MVRKAFDQFSFDLVVCLDQLAGFGMPQAIKSGTAVINLAEQAFGLIELRAQGIRSVRRSHELLRYSFCTQPPRTLAVSSMIFRRLFRLVRSTCCSGNCPSQSLNSQPIRVHNPAACTHAQVDQHNISTEEAGLCCRPDRQQAPVSA